MGVHIVKVASLVLILRHICLFHTHIRACLCAVVQKCTLGCQVAETDFSKVKQRWKKHFFSHLLAHLQI